MFIKDIIYKIEVNVSFIVIYHLYLFNLRNPCSQLSVLVPCTSANFGREGLYSHFGLSGGIHVSSVCFSQRNLSTRNSTLSINKIAPALPFFSWFTKMVLNYKLCCTLSNEDEVHCQYHAQMFLIEIRILVWEIHK